MLLKTSKNNSFLRENSKTLRSDLFFLFFMEHENLHVLKTLRHACPAALRDGIRQRRACPSGGGRRTWRGRRRHRRGLVHQQVGASVGEGAAGTLGASAGLTALNSKNPSFDIYEVIEARPV